jgi:hypothetical protein
MMAYSITDERMGWPGIATTDTVQRVPAGAIAHAVDPILGGGEFIYLNPHSPDDVSILCACRPVFA